MGLGGLNMISKIFKGDDQFKDLTQIQPDIETDMLEEIEEEIDGQLNVDVYQTPTEVVVVAPIAGVKPEDVRVEVSDDMVTISGERKEESKIEKDNYFAQECYWGGFSRSVVLPVPTNTEKSTASFKNGVLTLKIPKAGKAKLKTIKVRSL